MKPWLVQTFKPFKRRRQTDRSMVQGSSVQGVHKLSFNRPKAQPFKQRGRAASTI
jgi:hypothetical protein